MSRSVTAQRRRVTRMLAGVLAALTALPAVIAVDVALSAPASAETTLGAPRLSDPVTVEGFGNPTGGGAGASDCGPYALTAITADRNSTEGSLVGVVAGCSAVLSDGTAASLGPRFPAVGAGRTSAEVEGTTACPAGAVATGVEGRTGLLVDQVRLVCSPLLPDGTLGEPSPAAEATGGTGGGPAPAQACAPGSVAIGLAVRSGDSLDYLALRCAVLTFVVDTALRFAGGTSTGRVTAFAGGLVNRGTDITIEADVRWDGTPGLRGIVSTPRSDGLGDGLAEGRAIALRDGRPCLREVALGGVEEASFEDREVCAAAALPVGTWVHLTASSTGTRLTIAVNGVTTAREFPYPGTVLFGEGDPLVIGGVFATDVQNGVPAEAVSSFGGDIDDVRFSAGVAPAAVEPLLIFEFDEGAGADTFGQVPGSEGPIGRLTAEVPGQLPTWVDGAGTTSGPDNTSWPTALPITAGTPVDGALLRPGEARWYRFPVQPDARVTVDVTGLPADYDVTLFGDIGAAFTELDEPSDLNLLSAEFAADAFSPSVFSPSVFSPSVFSPSVFSPSVFSPSVFSPSVFSPSVFSPSVFSPSVFSPSVFSPSVFSPSVFSPSVFSPSVFSPSVFSPSVFSPEEFGAAFSSAQTRTLLGVSARDGRADESVSSATWDNTGYFYVRVTGRGGASSPEAYQLRLTTSGGACTTTLDPRTDLATAPAAPGGAATVILTDYSRLDGGAADLAALRTRVQDLATATGGAVVDLGSLPRLQALNAQADAVPDCPYAKNLVAQAAREIVNGYRGGDDRLAYVVIVGGDDVVPFFRYPDTSGLGPESQYVPPVADGTASQASLRRNTFLSQDAYGAATDLAVKGTELPVPDLAVGRLVETPAEITSTIGDFLALPNGTLPTATSSLVTGYDFLTDAADDVAGTLQAAIPGGRNEQLITDQSVPPTTTTPAGGPTRSASWTADDLRAELLGERHDVVYLAGHFSANSALAADYETSVLTRELAAAPEGTFRNTVVFSGGCHSGYNLLDDDGIPGLTEGLDWAQAFAAQGATLVAGTGYQYGDTDFLEYSERLYAGLARQLRTGTAAVPLGRALVTAKHEYLENTDALRGIHLKALMQATLYGLPMLAVDLPGRVTPPAPAGAAIDPAPVTTGPGAATLPDGAPGLGLEVADLAVDPELSAVTRALTSTEGGEVTATYLTGPDGVVTGPAEPALPRDTVDVTAEGLALRGVGLRSGTYTDTDGITPLTGAPATELNAPHGPFASSAFFPARLATPNYLGAIIDPDTGATRLTVTPAQHRSDAPGSTTTTLRRYQNLGFRLFYSANIATYGANTPALAAPPSISTVSGTTTPDGVAVRARVTGDPSAGVHQVWVTFTGERGGALHGSWQSVDLVQDPTDSTLWTGLIPLPEGQPSTGVRFLLQAVNGVGVVAADDARGAYYRPDTGDAATAPAEAPAASELTLGAPGDGQYGTSVRLTATLRAGNGGAPLAGRALEFSLGSVTRTAVTGDDGTAAADLPLLDLPGTASARVAFAGDAEFASATAGAPLTVTKRSTALVLSGPAQPPRVGDDPGVVATLTSAGLPVRAASVYLAVLGVGGEPVTAATRITDAAGRVQLPATNLAAGTYTVRASFGGDVPLPGGGSTSLADPVLAAAVDDLTLLVVPRIGPPATVTAVSGGGQQGTAGQPFDAKLVARVTDAAGSPVPGTVVTWRITSGPARFGGDTTTTTTTTTGDDGSATAPDLIAGTSPGAVTVTAGAEGATAATFRLDVVRLLAARSDLVLRLSSPASVPRGGTFTATVTVRNAGPNTAGATATTLAFGSGLRVTGADGGRVGTGIVTWTTSGLPVGAERTYTVTLTATAGRPTSTALVAATASLVPDPRPANNGARRTINLT